MRVQCLQHVPFEGPAAIADWAAVRGYRLKITRLFEEELPQVGDFDLLVVMGGPMGVGDEAAYPWLRREKRLIRKAIDAGVSVLGVCLGAQLIAETLGATVFPNRYKEIGWFPINVSESGAQSPLLKGLPRTFDGFHWHGDTFDLPPHAFHLASSAGCQNQAFLYRDRVLALQFHLEATAHSVRQIVAHCADEIVPGRYIQDAEAMHAAGAEDFRCLNSRLFSILDRLTE